MSPLPYYRQLADTLRAEISSGHFAPGDPIPALTTLVQESGLDPKTVRQAVRVLADEGLVTVARGRRTLVRPQPG